MDPRRIAVIAPTWFPVPPPLYGGIEHVVSLLADRLAESGYEVTLFASGDSHTKAELVSVYKESPSDRVGHALPEVRNALACYTRAEDFDIINDHSGLAAAGLSRLVHTVHGPLDGEAGAGYDELAKLTPGLGFISISLNQRRPLPNLPWVGNCPNAIELSVYPSHPHRGDYLLFLGRMTPDKGCHRAVAVAMEAELPLKIAGKRREAREHRYFDELVRTHLHDGIEYVGEVSHGEKVELLQNARATLFPIDWEEPFGLVMIESMACGTPVIATRWGADPAVIDHGRSGIIVDHYNEMSAALEAADRLDPIELRRYVEEEFSPHRMVRDYLAAYEAAIDQAG